MDPIIALAPLIVAIVGAVTGIGGLILAVRKLIADKRAGVAGQENERRRDTISDRDALIETLQEEMRDLRARVSTLERDLGRERDHSRALEDHIYRGNPPPPPVRPDYHLT